MDTNMKLDGIVRTVTTSVRPDEDTPKSESIKVYLQIDYSDCTLGDVLTFASANRVIAWATTGRKNCGVLTPGETIKIKAGQPTTRSIDAKASTLSWAQTASPEEVEAYIAKLKARVAK
jgi:hypothetical protein